MKAGKFAVVAMRSPKEVWDHLKDTNQSVFESTIDTKLGQVQEIQMKTSESVVQYLNRIQRICNELKRAEYTARLTEKRRALLPGLTAMFKIAVCVLRCSGKYYNNCISELIIHEASHEHSSSECALVTSTRSQRLNTEEQKWSHYGRYGYDSAQCWHNPQSSSYKLHINRGKGGTNRGRGRGGRGGRVGRGGRQPAPNNGGNQPVAFITKNINKEESKQLSSTEWVIDWACTAHIYNQISNFHTFTPVKRKVQVGNQEYIDALRYGDVHKTDKNWGKDKAIILQDVFYVPDLVQNLISVSQCQRNGCKAEIDCMENSSRGVMQIIHKQSKQVVLVGPESEGLYKAELLVP